MYPPNMTLQSGGLELSPTLYTLHLQVCVDCLHMLHGLVIGFEGCMAFLAAEVPDLVMNHLDVVLYIYHHFATLLKWTQCPDLSAAPILVSSLDMIHQAANPDITKWAQLHPVHLFSTLGTGSFLWQQSAYLGHHTLGDKYLQ